MNPNTLFYIIISILIISFIIDKVLDILNEKHFDDEIPDKLKDVYDEKEYKKSQEYKKAKAKFSNITSFFSTILTLVFFFADGFKYVDNFARTYTENPILVALIFFGIIIIGSDIITTPLSYYSTFVIEEKFGFNKMTLGMFFGDLLKQTILAALLGLPLLFCILWLMEKMGENWWLYAWFAWIAFNLFILAIFPTWIAPLFNKFTPLEDTTLKSKIEQLMTKCGFKSSGLFVMDGSRRSSHGNAYFTGFGKTKRIVFFDTLLSRLSPTEIVAVLAHELGHFKHRHVLKRIVSSLVMSLIFLWILGYAMEQTWFYEGLGVSVSTVPSPAIALLLFFLVMPVFTFLFSPISSLYSRKHEFEADAYAAKNSSAEDLINALVKLYQDNASTLTPDPIHSAFYDSHPPASIRVVNLQNQGLR